MRWSGLFEDLEAQALALERAERDAEVDERTRIEVSRLALVDRLVPAVGAELRMRCVGGLVAAGAVRRVGRDWVLLSAPGGAEVLVALWGVRTVAGLGRMSASPEAVGLVESRLRITHVLRGIARDRSVGQLWLSDGFTINATIDRVGKDFVEVATHSPGEARRRSEVREIQLVALHSLVALRRDAL